MNDVTTPADGRPWLGRFFSLVGWLHYWFILVFVLLVALAKGLIEPFLLEPAVARTLQQVSDDMAQRLGKKVDITFGEVNVSFGLKGMYLVVTEPGIAVGDRQLRAGEAALVIRPESLPLLVVREARIALEVDGDGNLGIIGVPLESLEGMFGGGDPQAAAPNLPSSLVAVDTNVSFTFADGERLELPPITAALKPDLENQRLVMSLRSGIDEPLRFTGRMHIPLGQGQRGTDFYLSASGIENALLDVGIRTGMQNGRLQVWGSHSQSGLVDAVATAQADGMAYALTLNVADGQATGDGQAVVSAPDSLLESGAMQVEVSLAASNLASDFRYARMQWAASLDSVNLQVPETILGANLALDRIEASGTASIDPDGIALGARGMRLAGPVGTGSMDMSVETDLEGHIDIELRGSAPVMDVATVTNLLPLSLSERGVPFLRNDLQVPKAQLVTIVVAGDDFATFPWKDGQGGVFRMQVDFFDASLDYAEGYPPLASATGGFGLEGAALAVTVVEGTAGPATLESGRAGVDDLDAPVSTLFVALDAHLPDGALDGLLRTLPATRAEAAPLLAVLTPEGEQDMRLALVINLDEDVPVGVDGVLDVLPGGKVTHLPSGFVAEDLTGSFGFTNAGVEGIALGEVLDTEVRISVGFTDQVRALLLEGNFDIAGTAAKLGQELPVPLSGSSALSLRAGTGDILIESDLLGTEVGLPAPFGKSRDERRKSRLLVTDTLLRLDYGEDFVKTVSEIGKDPIALSFGKGAPPAAPPESGIEISGAIDGLDVDALIGGMTGGGAQPEQEITAQLTLSNAVLLGMDHPELLLGATVASTVTVATLEAASLQGTVSMAGATVIADIARLEFPEDDVDPSELDSDATIYVEPGVLTPELPPLSVMIDDLAIGKRRYQQVQVTGFPSDGQWVLDRLRALVGENEITASGRTNTSGEPGSEVTLQVLMPDLPGFFANYSDKEDDGEGESILEGDGEITGAISWQGALNDPHSLSMTGNLSLSGQNVVISEDSSGARLLNLLSPFTILQTLPSLSVGDGTTRFDRANGRMTIEEGNLVVEEILLEGADIDLRINGSTNLITERNNLHGTVVVKSSDNITTGAVTFVNPIAGALLLVFDKVLDAPLIGDLELRYDVTGTWDEPVVTQELPEGADGG